MSTKTFAPPPMPHPADYRPVVRALLRWYRVHGRALPWRGTSSTYRILLSEVMLQQTQVSRVLVKYPQFLRRFPTLRSLARARQRDVVTLWRGMGYNNRAVRLYRLARQVTEHHAGRIPRKHELLLALPGIGEYTASAIRSSAFHQPVPAVDVNVRRVLSRMFKRMASVSAVRPEREIDHLARQVLPRTRAYDWNQALMDLGATVCTARAPRCMECPVSRWCRSTHRMTRATAPATRTEPARNGIPNRIYRGRIIDMLRNTGQRHGVAAATLGHAVLPDFSHRDASWLDALLDGLERDELIRVRGNGTATGKRVALR
jgi:A/G-specific adenine glycosylase